MADTLPLALAIAASPFPIIPAILLLFTPRARAASLSFLVGWLLGIGAATTVFVLLAEVIEVSEESPSWLSWGRIALGVALVVLGIHNWLSRGEAGESPAWMRSVSTAGPGKAFTLALLLSAANPKILLLAAAAGLAIGAEGMGAADTVTAVVAFTAVAAVTVAVPVVLYAVLGQRVLRPLGVAKDWLETHNAALMSVVITVIGVALLVKGIQGL